MTIYEIGSIIISVIALLISLGSFYKSNSIALGNIELMIRERISSSKALVQASVQTMVPLVSKMNASGLNSQEDLELNSYRAIFNSSVEDNINAYEEACAKFLDRKVDRKRFKKMYKSEIKQLVENTDYSNYFHPTTTRYKAIMKVYELWENLER